MNISIQDNQSVLKNDQISFKLTLPFKGGKVHSFKMQDGHEWKVFYLRHGVERQEPNDE